MKTVEIPHLILHVNSLTKIFSTSIKRKKEKRKSQAMPVSSDPTYQIKGDATGRYKIAGP